MFGKTAACEREQAESIAEHETDAMTDESAPQGLFSPKVLETMKSLRKVFFSSATK